MNSKKKVAIICTVVVLVLAIIIALLVIFLNKPKFVTITFNTDGGTPIEAMKIEKNHLLQFPANPTKEGYTFLYWADPMGTPILKDIYVIGDLTLTAKWAEETAETVTVTFNTDGGTAIEKLETVKGEKITLPENPTKKDYTFEKWVKEDGEDFNAELPIDEDMTLKAIWKEAEKKEETKNEVNKTEEKPAEEKVDATGITLNKSTVDLIIGNTGALTATVTPDNAKDKTVTWASSDASVISVDNSGNLKALKIGKATITATTVNGKSTSATVYSDVESISLSVSKEYISKYNGATSSATLTVTTNPSVDPSLITWSAPDASGSTAAAYFSKSGATATVTARECWGYSLYKIPVTVSVGRKTASKDVNVEPQLSTYFLEGGNSVVKGNNVKISSYSIPVTWTLTTNLATDINKQSTTLSFKAKNESTHADGFQITVKTNAGQTKTIPITVTLV